MSELAGAPSRAIATSLEEAPPFLESSAADSSAGTSATAQLQLDVRILEESHALRQEVYQREREARQALAEERERPPRRE